MKFGDFVKVKGLESAAGFRDNLQRLGLAMPCDDEVALGAASPLAQPLPQADALLRPQQRTILSEKAQVATDVEAEDRHAMRGQVSGRPEHRAVPTQHQGQIGRARLGAPRGLSSYR